MFGRVLVIQGATSLSGKVCLKVGLFRNPSEAIVFERWALPRCLVFLLLVMLSLSLLLIWLGEKRRQPICNAFTAIAESYISLFKPSHRKRRASCFRVSWWNCRIFSLKKKTKPTKNNYGEKKTYVKKQTNLEDCEDSNEKQFVKNVGSSQGPWSGWSSSGGSDGWVLSWSKALFFYVFFSFFFLGFTIGFSKVS